MYFLGGDEDAFIADGDGAGVYCINLDLEPFSIFAKLYFVGAAQVREDWGEEVPELQELACCLVRSG